MEGGDGAEGRGGSGDEEGRGWAGRMREVSLAGVADSGVWLVELELVELELVEPVLCAAELGGEAALGEVELVGGLDSGAALAEPELAELELAEPEMEEPVGAAELVGGAVLVEEVLVEPKPAEWA